MTNEELETLIVGLTSIKKQKWFVRSEVEAIVAAALSAPHAGISPAPLAGNSEAMHAKAFVAYRATDPSVCGFALFMAGWRAALSQGDVSGEGEGS